MVLPYLLLAEALLLAIALPAMSVRPARGLWSMLVLGAIAYAAFAAHSHWAGEDGARLLAWMSVFGGPFLVYTAIRTAGGYLHRRVGGAPDRRYRDNPWVPAFAENTRMTAGFGHLGNLLAGVAAIVTIYLAPLAPSAPTPVEFPVTVTATTAENAVLRDACYLRARPRQDGEVVDTLPPGTTLVVIEKLGLWWQVTAAERRGFVHRSCVKAPSRP